MGLAPSCLALLASMSPLAIAVDDPPVMAPAPTNHLAQSSSPYLLQHAHNPVDWYPWGPEALERARREDKPIFLSVGYSTCYWCHVMEREVFENEALAKLVNENFVCIKVDREERPDLDEIYMTVTQLMTRHGGWPNSVFLTPDLKAFHAGTYYGPVDQPGRPGFGTIVTELSEAWRDRRPEVMAVAERVGAAVEEALGGQLTAGQGPAVGLKAIDQAVAQLLASADRRDGGFGAAPKFPSDFFYPFLLDFYRTGIGNAGTAPLDVSVLTLDAMAAGGIHDHVGGGFHRYSVDGQWQVPHFEKMLYNQALLAVAYLEAYEVTRQERFADVARGIFRFVDELFTGPEGQFYSALDAETDAVEGAYFVWTPEEIAAVLGAGDAEAFLTEFELVAVPEFPGHQHATGGTLVRRERATALSAATKAMLAKLAARRGMRKLPRLDDKSIAGWNGMMITALARGAQVLGDDQLLRRAERAADFILARMRLPDGRLLRSVRGGAGRQHGFLEDYAWVIRGLLGIVRAEDSDQGRARYLAAACVLQSTVDALLWDEAAGAYYFAEPDADLLSRSKDVGDNATPGGNSVMAHALLEMSQATGDPAYRQRAQRIIAAFAGLLQGSPRAAVHMVHALGRSVWPKPAVVATSAEQVRLSASAGPVKLGRDGAPAEVVLEVRLTIAPGWHVNTLAPLPATVVPTLIEVLPTAAAEVIAVESPPPALLTAAAAGASEAISIHQGEATFVMRLSCPTLRQSGDRVQLLVKVCYQACSSGGTCLASAIWSGGVEVRAP